MVYMITYHDLFANMAAIDSFAGIEIIKGKR